MTYEYVCKSCGHEWEAEHGMSEPSVKDCPKCGKGEAQRVISRPSFILKGPGWADDGYS